MNQVILSHLKDIKDFRNLACLYQTKITEEFFTFATKQTTKTKDNLYLLQEKVKSQTRCIFKKNVEGWDITYSKAGIKIEETYFHKGEKEGVSISYYEETGNIYKKTSYHLGIHEGPFIEYYQTGEKYNEGFYHLGFLHGVQTTYINGRKDYEINYSYERKHGAYIWYFENMIVKSKETYEHDMRHGHCVYYFKNGDIESEGSYFANKKHGVWKYHDRIELYHLGERE